MEIRERLATAAAAELVKLGSFVYGPITESNQYEHITDLPSNWEYWGEKDKDMLARCDKLYVLMLKGWEESIGVQAEIAYAKELKIPIVFVDPARLLRSYNVYFNGEANYVGATSKKV